MGIVTQDATQNIERLVLNWEMYAFSLYAVEHFLALLLVMGCAAVILLRESPGRLRELAILHMGILGAWLLSKGMARLAVEPEIIVYWLRCAYFFVPLGSAVLYHYIILMLGLERQRRYWTWAIWVSGWLMALLPVVFFYAMPNVAGLQEFPWGMEPRHGWFGTLTLGWAIFWICAASRDLLVRWKDTSQYTDEGRRVRVLAIGSVIAFCTVTDWLVAEGLSMYPLGAFTVSAFFLSIVFITMKYGMVEVSAAIAGERLLRSMNTATLILNRDGRVQAANDAACELFERSQDKLLLQKLGELLPKSPSLERLAARSDSTAERVFTFRYLGKNEEREYSISVSAVANRIGEPQAYICLLRDLTLERNIEQERLEASLHDPLTGLPGRSLFIQYLQRALGNRGEETGVVGVLFISIDRFSKINEELSYACGDFLLSYVGGWLEDFVGPYDVVGRVGGDEFAVVLRSPREPGELDLIARRILKKLEEPVSVEGNTVHMTASIGISAARGASPDAEALMRNAVMAMNAAKTAGGHGVKLYDARESYADSGEVTLEAQIRKGIEHDEFVPYYQPIVHLDSGHIVGFEMLARWNHPEDGLREADKFVDFAESTGLITGISRNLQARAFRDLKVLKQQFGADVSVPYLSINASEAEFNDPDYVTDLISRVFDAGIDCDDIVIELTERIVMISSDDHRLRYLKSSGFRLLIDDFGTGYSSMTRLHKLPIHGLKIDRQFVVEMADGGRAENLVAGMIGLARSLDLTVVAEGVEQEQVLAVLRSCGCDFVQGYYFGKPKSAMNIEIQ